MIEKGLVPLELSLGAMKKDDGLLKKSCRALHAYMAGLPDYEALDTLFRIGLCGTPENDCIYIPAGELRLTDENGFLKTGFTREAEGEHLCITCPQYPAIFQALSKMAKKAETDKINGRFFFSCCDFRALYGRHSPSEDEIFEKSGQYADTIRIIAARAKELGAKPSVLENRVVYRCGSRTLLCIYASDGQGRVKILCASDEQTKSAFFKSMQNADAKLRRFYQKSLDYCDICPYPPENPFVCTAQRKKLCCTGGGIGVRTDCPDRNILPEITELLMMAAQNKP